MSLLNSFDKWWGKYRVPLFIIVGTANLIIGIVDFDLRWILLGAFMVIYIILTRKWSNVVTERTNHVVP